MNRLNISKCIIHKRKEKGITQEQLAEHMAVSKAAVSKWESGQSYPDILLLPELATFFNISVDELLGYSPQLTGEDIKKIYHQLAHAFATRPFSEVMEECDKTIKKYYSCFPFLLAMIQLLLNHSVMAETEDMKKAILQQCISLSRRVKTESDSSSDCKSANVMEALAEMALGNSAAVTHLLNEKLVPYSGEDVILIMAYQMLGENAQADKVNQILLYQNVIGTITLLTNYLTLHMAEPALFEQIYSQGKQIIEAFQLKEILTNAVFGIHIAAAQGYLLQQEPEKALNALEEYADTVGGYKFPLKLKGNAYFDRVNEWLEDNVVIGTGTPIDDITVKTNFIRAMEENPAFSALKGEEKYQRIIGDLKAKLGGKNN